MYFRVLGRRGGADAADLPARQGRLQDVGGVERPFGRARAHEGVQLVDEHDDVRVLGELLHDRLQALLELPAVLRARDDQRDVEGEDALVGQEVRHVAADNLLSEPFDDGGLADAGLADEDRVVLRAAAEHLLDPLELVVAPDQRVELVLHRRLGQVAAELGEERRLLDARQRRLLVEQLDNILADGVQAHPLFHEDGRGHRALLAKDAEQQVLRADVVVEQPVRLFGGKLKDPFGFGAERYLDRGGDFLPENRAAFYFFSNGLERQVRAGKDAAGQSLTFTDQPE